MLRNVNLVLWILIILLAVIAVGFFFVLMQGIPEQWVGRGGPAIPAEEVGEAAEVTLPTEEFAELIWQTPEIRTNLVSGNLIQIQFMLQVSEKKTVEELDIRYVQVSDAMIRLIQGMSKEELLKKEGLEKLHEQLKQEVNQFLQSGKVEQVFTVQKVIQ